MSCKHVIDNPETSPLSVQPDGSYRVMMGHKLEEALTEAIYVATSKQFEHGDSTPVILKVRDVIFEIFYSSSLFEMLEKYAAGEKVIKMRDTCFALLPQAK